jgi:hypothetical protein
MFDIAFKNPVFKETKIKELNWYYSYGNDGHPTYVTSTDSFKLDKDHIEKTVE